MKKFAAIVATVLVLAMTFAMTVSAGPHGVIENPAVTVEKFTPTVDGTINENEGWSTSALMNAETCGYFWHQAPLTTDGNVRFAWDDDNLYFCANIVEGFSAVREADAWEVPEGYNQFIYSTGLDNLDVASDGSTYGYNGDVFGLLVDPMSLFVEYGFTGNQDYTPWYLVGLFEGNVAKMYREKVNQGDITDQVSVAGKATDKGWCFEAAIPWDIIIKDVNDITFGEIEVVKEDLLANGAITRVAALYQDRFLDPEMEEVATWGRFVTVPTTLPDGNPGHMGSGDNAMSLGIQLVIANSGSDTTTAAPNTDETTTAKPGETTTAAEETSVQEVTDEKGNAVTDEKGNKVTQVVKVTKKPTSGKPTGGSSAQTFDMGIAVALGALAASGIGFVASKKRK